MIENLRVRPARTNNRLLDFSPCDAINDTKLLTPDVIYSRAVGGGTLLASWGNTVFADEEMYSWGHFTTPMTLVNTDRLLFKLIVSVEQAPVPPFSANGIVRVWIMTTDWVPATLTWNTQPVFAGRRLDQSVYGDFSGGDFVHEREISFQPRINETYYGVVIQVVSSLPRGTCWVSGEMRYPYSSLRPCRALKLVNNT